MKPEKTRSPKTVNMNTMRISSLFNYAVKNGYMSSNPAADLQIKINKRADQQREAFSPEDLDKLFNSPDYKNGTHKHPYRFWIPLIALYSGCRLEEICQLHLEDIRQEDSVWVFDINDKEGRQLKNRSSVRLLPIHPFLIKMGLLVYADSLREKEDIDRLFPELRNTQQGKYGHYPSRWFATYRQKCGVGGPGKTFHSFRHTFITQLKHKQVDSFMLQELD